MRITEQHHGSDPLESDKITRAALQAFFSIAREWDLSIDQQRRLLGDVPRATYFKWKSSTKGAPSNCHLTKDTLERISYLLGIYKALGILLPNKLMANQWVHKSNAAPLFNNQTALDRMLAGNITDLADVRRYLDAERGS
jgi:hypothetical protein